MARNLNSASGNLIVTGGNLVLPPVAISLSRYGFSGIYTPVQAKQRGKCSMDYIPGKNLVVSGGNLVSAVIGIPRNLTLAPLHVKRACRGRTFSATSVTRCSRGHAQSFMAITGSRARGQAKWVYETFNIIKHRGDYRIFDGIARVQRGVTDIQNSIWRTGRGAHAVHMGVESALRGQSGVRNSTAGSVRGFYQMYAQYARAMRGNAKWVWTSIPGGVRGRFWVLKSGDDLDATQPLLVTAEMVNIVVAAEDALRPTLEVSAEIVEVGAEPLENEEYTRCH